GILLCFLLLEPLMTKNTTYPTKPVTTALALPNTQTVTKYPATNTTPQRKWLTYKEIGKKRAKGLCFYCDQKYMPGHKCSGQMFVLEVSPDEREHIEDSLETHLGEEVESPNANGELLLSECYASLQISLNAISGVPTYNTMRMKAMVNKHLLHLLMDTGSTHNFLDLFTAKKLGCKLTKTYPLQVMWLEEIKCQPFTTLLKKNAFSWTNEAQAAFENLQQAMSQAPVLALPNFQEEFVIETDASGYGISAVLQQKGHHIAFLSKALAHMHQSLSAYEKELLAVVVALQKWRGYLLDRHFKIRTDHFSLKSQREGELLTILTALPSNEFIEAISTMLTTDRVLSGIVKDLQDGSLVTSKYSWQNDQLKRKGRWVVGPDEQLRTRMVLHFHTLAVGGHSGVQATFKRLGSFSIGRGKSTVLVVVDRLSKQAHFIAVTHLYHSSIIPGQHL
nr:hypothetical protein [Tanacetum cinerariifolium]